MFGIEEDYKEDNHKEFIKQLELQQESQLELNHYDNSKGSIYQFAEDQNLNPYEFDLIKRIVRCRKKGKFVEDLEKTKFLIDLYIKEYGKNK